MKKRIMSFLCALVLVLGFNQVIYAENEDIRPPAPPPIDMESIDSNISIGDEISLSPTSPQSAILFEWWCTITFNKGNNSLYMIGRQNAFYFCDQKLTIYLQKWDGTKWVDVTSWIFIEFNTAGILEDASFSFYEPGNYYRARAVHYAKYGNQTHTTESTAPYIYVN
ncbi:hypothetical protein [Acetivibrio clariflavus]|nr:hypothetical protein [Acetivibrio clariflavus]